MDINKLIQGDNNINEVFKLGVNMGAVKETYLNGLNREAMEVETGVSLQGMGCQEYSLVKNIVLYLEMGVDQGLIERDQAEYLVFRPIEAGDWILDNLGVRLV